MPRYNHYSREHLEMLQRLREAKPARLLKRPDSPHMGTLWDGRYTVASGGRLVRWIRLVPGFRARRAEYVVEIDRSEGRIINFRLENSSGDVVASIRFSELGAPFKGQRMTYPELTAKAATVMLEDLRKGVDR